MDHIISLKPSSDNGIAQDWYKMHVLLSRRLGARVDEAGNALWNFAADPRMLGTPAMAQTRFLLVRTNTPHLDELAAGIAAKSFDTCFPKAGDTVRFDLACSGRTGRPGVERRLKQAFEASQAGIKLRTSTCPGNIGPQIQMSADKITGAGLEIDGTFTDISDKVFRLYKGRRHEGRAITVVGVFSSGIATVRDEAALHAAIRNGVGRDRSFGFGILLTEHLKEKVAA